MVKLTVKTIKGKKFQIEVEQTQTVSQPAVKLMRCEKEEHDTEIVPQACHLPLPTDVSSRSVWLVGLAQCITSYKDGQRDGASANALVSYTACPRRLNTRLLNTMTGARGQGGHRTAKRGVPRCTAQAYPLGPDPQG